jgi:hypothetical protein
VILSVYLPHLFNSCKCEILAVNSLEGKKNYIKVATHRGSNIAEKNGMLDIKHMFDKNDTLNRKEQLPTMNV